MIEVLKRRRRRGVFLRLWMRRIHTAAQEELAVFRAERSAQVVYSNARLSSIFGYERDENVSARDSWINCMQEQSRVPEGWVHLL